MGIHNHKKNEMKEIVPTNSPHALFRQLCVQHRDHTLPLLRKLLTTTLSRIPLRSVRYLFSATQQRDNQPSVLLRLQQHRNNRLRESRPLPHIIKTRICFLLNKRVQNRGEKAQIGLLALQIALDGPQHAVGDFALRLIAGPNQQIGDEDGQQTLPNLLRKERSRGEQKLLPLLVAQHAQQTLRLHGELPGARAVDRERFQKVVVGLFDVLRVGGERRSNVF